MAARAARAHSSSWASGRAGDADAADQPPFTRIGRPPPNTTRRGRAEKPNFIQSSWPMKSIHFWWRNRSRRRVEVLVDGDIDGLDEGAGHPQEAGQVAAGIGHGHVDLHASPGRVLDRSLERHGHGFGGDDGLGNCDGGNGLIAHGGIPVQELERANGGPSARTGARENNMGFRFERQWFSQDFYYHRDN